MKRFSDYIHVPSTLAQKQKLNQNTKRQLYKVHHRKPLTRLVGDDQALVEIHQQCKHKGVATNTIKVEIKATNTDLTLTISPLQWQQLFSIENIQIYTAY